MFDIIKHQMVGKELGDKNIITCDDIRFLRALGAKPKTERGRNLINQHSQEHQEKGTRCFDAQDALDIHLDSNDPENRCKVEDIFGPCEWPR